MDYCHFLDTVTKVLYSKMRVEIDTVQSKRVCSEAMCIRISIKALLVHKPATLQNHGY